MINNPNRPLVETNVPLAATVCVLDMTEELAKVYERLGTPNAPAQSVLLTGNEVGMLGSLISGVCADAVRNLGPWTETVLRKAEEITPSVVGCEQEESS